jgi:hypothetical protein
MKQKPIKTKQKKKYEPIEFKIGSWGEHAVLDVITVEEQKSMDRDGVSIESEIAFRRSTYRNVF